MTVEQLMQPRVKCIGHGDEHYPGSPYKIRQIITFDHDLNGRLFHKGYPSALFQEDVDKYPHLFQPLPWYAERAIEDMPEYVKTTITDSKDVVTFVVEKVVSYPQRKPILKDSFDAMGVSPVIQTESGLKYACDWEPATESDYLTCKNAQK